MKTHKQLLKEASILKQKLVQVENRIALTETRRMQKLAGIIKENFGDLSKQGLDAQLVDFCKELGANTEDELIQLAIKTSAERNDPDELLTILADTMGGGEGDPDPFDGVFTFSDIENAIVNAGLSKDMYDMITDDDRIKNLEVG
jgi:predicted P-loop ATPase